MASSTRTTSYNSSETQKLSLQDNDYSRDQPTRIPDAPPRDNQCEVILATHANLPKERMEEAARDSLWEALGQNQIFRRQEENRLVAADHSDTAAKDIREEFRSQFKSFRESMEKSLQEKDSSFQERMQTEWKIYHDQNVSLRANVSSLQENVSSLQTRVGTLEKSSKLIRSRFISTFKRDILKTANEDDQWMAVMGNDYAHGDVRADAMLYDGPDARTDISTFEELYGVSPRIASTLKRTENEAAMNRYASVISSTHMTPSERFIQNYQKFIEALRKMGFDENHPGKLGESVAHARSEFLKVPS